MEHNRPRLSDRTMQPASAGIGADFRRVQSNGAATLAELRDFLGKMRGRTPQEVLGAVANNSLMKCLVWSTVGTVVLFVVGTLIPYYVSGGPAPKKPAKPEAPAVAAPAKTEQPAAGDAKKPAEGATAEPQDPALANAQKAAEKMQMNEARQADPKKNPLEKDLDKLLELKE